MSLELVINELNSIKPGFVSKSDVSVLINRVTSILESEEPDVVEDQDKTKEHEEAEATISNLNLVIEELNTKSIVSSEELAASANKIESLTSKISAIVEISNSLSKFRERTGMKDEFKTEFNELLDKLENILTSV